MQNVNCTILIELRSPLSSELKIVRNASFTVWKISLTHPLFIKTTSPYNLVHKIYANRHLIYISYKNIRIMIILNFIRVDAHFFRVDAQWAQNISPIYFFWLTYTVYISTHTNWQCDIKYCVTEHHLDVQPYFLFANILIQSYWCDWEPVTFQSTNKVS